MSTDAPDEKDPPRVATARRDQLSMEVVDLESLLAEDHRARVIWAAVERLDLSVFYDEIRARGSAPGRPALDPKVLLALWLFATSEGVGSAKHLSRLCTRDLPYRWLCGGLTPNAHALSDFRSSHGEKLDALLTQVLAVLMNRKLVSLRRVAQDGMRVRAHAGASSFGRKPRIERCREEAQAQVEALKAELESEPSASVDRSKSAKLRAAQERASRLDAAMRELPSVERVHARTRSQRARNAAKKGKKLSDKGPRVSTTDVDARIMKMGDGGFRPAFNVQFATDVDSRCIVGVDVTNVGSDRNAMLPMLKQIEARTGQRPQQYLVDGGFAKLEAITEMEVNGIEVFAPVPKPRADGIDPHARRPTDNDHIARWRRRMATDEAKRIYAERGAVAEWVNADQRRWRDMKRASLVGLEKVLAQARMGALMHNILRAHAIAA